MSNHIDLVKKFYYAFSKVDRDSFVENLIAPNFTFSAPPDPLLDRDGFFERCWPNGDKLKDIEYIRVIENANEVIITHEYTKPDSKKGCNTDIFTFYEDKIIRLEVFFGWDIKS